MESETGLRYGSVFAAFTELVDIGIVVLNEAGELDFASGRARSLLGCGEDVRLAACPPQVRRSIQSLFEQILRDDSEMVDVDISFRFDEQDRHLLLEAHMIDEDDCSGVLMLVKDADRMRRLALDLRMSAQFRNTRRLYQAVADDLKQPITAALVHLDLLRETLGADAENGGKPSVPGEKSIRIIKEQVTELSRILRLLSEEINPAETEERGFSLRDVLQDVARLIEPQAAIQNVATVIQPGNHAARMTGSRQRVKQAILNLAINALDAMPNGGEFEMSLDVNEAVATIRIKDSGYGITPDVLPHIFEMHYTTKEAGTGAGLYVARDVIDRHGGNITVDRSTNQGTCFNVTLAVSESAS